MSDPVHHPAHYTVYPVQPIEITRHLGFCVGNVAKYVLRAPYKGGLEDLRKALQYLEWEKETPMRRLTNAQVTRVTAASEKLRVFLQERNMPHSALLQEFLERLEIYVNRDPASVGAATSLQVMGDIVRTLLSTLPRESEVGRGASHEDNPETY